MMRLGDGPADPDAPQLSDAGKRMIMHIELPNEMIDLPAPARHAVEQLLTQLAAGNAVHVLADDQDMTTQDVAELLGLSRTFVVRLIDEGKLTAHFAGSHRRVRAADAFAYARHRQARLDGVAAITAADIAAGVPYHWTRSGEDRS